MKDPLILIEHPNGGWTIERRASDRGMMNEPVGAYSTANHMIDALREILIEDESTDLERDADLEAEKNRAPNKPRF